MVIRVYALIGIALLVVALWLLVLGRHFAAMQEQRRENPGVEPVNIKPNPLSPGQRFFGIILLFAGLALLVLNVFHRN